VPGNAKKFDERFVEELAGAMTDQLAALFDEPTKAERQGRRR